MHSTSLCSELHSARRSTAVWKEPTPSKATLRQAQGERILNVPFVVRSSNHMPFIHIKSAESILPAPSISPKLQLVNPPGTPFWDGRSRPQRLHRGAYGLRLQRTIRLIFLTDSVESTTFRLSALGITYDINPRQSASSMKISVNKNP